MPRHKPNASQVACEHREHHRPCDPAGARRTERGRREERSVHGAVELSSEARRAAAACEPAVGGIGHPADRDHAGPGGAARGRGHERHQRNPRQRQAVGRREPKAALTARTLDHAEMPLEHRPAERPPRKRCQPSRPAARGGEECRARPDDPPPPRLARERGPCPTGRSRALERAAEEVEPSVWPVVLGPQVEEQLARPALAVCQRRISQANRFARSYAASAAIITTEVDRVG